MTLSTPSDVRSRFRFFFPVDVRFRDLDAIGHVNNAVYLTYLESARIAYWMEVTGGRDLGDLGMILARAEIDYRSPVSYGESLEVGVRCASLGRSSFVLELAVFERSSGRLVAEARKVLVHYDYAAARSRPLAPELRRLLLARDPDAREG
jgi:acyl-CoA thioester hydrolase